MTGSGGRAGRTLISQAGEQKRRKGGLRDVFGHTRWKS